MSAQESLSAIRKHFRPYMGHTTGARLEAMVRLCEDGRLPECVFVAATGILQALEVRSKLRGRLNQMRERDLLKVVSLASEKCARAADVAAWLERSIR